MEKIPTRCPNCQKELEAKVFAASGVTTHRVSCMFCQTRFSIDNSGDVVGGGIGEAKDGGKTAYLGISQGKKRVVLQAPEGSVGYDLIRKASEEMGKNSRQQQQGMGRPLSEIDSLPSGEQQGESPGPLPPGYQGPPAGHYNPYGGPPSPGYQGPGQGGMNWGGAANTPYGPAMELKFGKRRGSTREVFFYFFTAIFLFLFAVNGIVYYDFPENAGITGDDIDIFGTVSNETGMRIANASISIVGYDNHSALSDENGSFRLKDVPTGERSILVQAEGYQNLTFTTYLGGEAYAFEHSGQDKFGFQLSETEVQEEDKRDTVKGQGNFISATSIAFIFLLLLLVLLFYRRENYIQTMGVSIFSVLFAFTLYFAFGETSTTPYAFSYFIFGCLMIYTMRAEFLLADIMGKLGGQPGVQTQGPQEVYPSLGSLRQQSYQPGNWQGPQPPTGGAPGWGGYPGNQWQGHQGYPPQQGQTGNAQSQDEIRNQQSGAGLQRQPARRQGGSKQGKVAEFPGRKRPVRTRREDSEEVETAVGLEDSGQEDDILPATEAELVTNEKKKRE